MKYIGNSLIWSKDKVKRFINFCIQDEKINDKKRESYYYKIVTPIKNNDNKGFLGIIGFHKFNIKELSEFHDKFFMTTFIMKKYQNMGIFSKAYELLINKISHHQPKVKNLYSLVRKTNDKMLGISNKKNIFVKEIKIKDEYFNIYYLPISHINTKTLTKYKSKLKSKQKSYISIGRKTKKNKLTQKIFKSKKHTFLIYVENFNKEIAENFLIQRGNWVKYDESKLKSKNYPPVDFVYIDNTIYLYNKKLYSVKCFIKNMLNEKKHSVSRKDALYENLGKIVKEHPSSYSLKTYLLEQHNFNWLEIYSQNLFEQKFQEIKTLFENNPNKIWIYKPVSGFKGMFIEIFSTYDQFKIFIDKFIEKQILIWSNKEIKTKLLTLEQWVLQEYIEDPYLFQNKKFHIRPIFLYHKNGNNKIGYILNKILVAHAYDNYKFEDFNNKRIHDTHFASTSRRLFFHEDFIDLNIMTKEQVERIEEQIMDLANYVFDQLNSRCYPESKECYEVFGMDLLIDNKTLTIKLMEVQVTNISFGHFDDDRLPGFSNMFEYIYCNTVETVIDQYFPPINPIKKINGFKQFYKKAIKD
jgi:hypothetical protein